jgi:hypothetical protein
MAAPRRTGKNKPISTHSTHTRPKADITIHGIQAAIRATSFLFYGAMGSFVPMKTSLLYFLGIEKPFLRKLLKGNGHSIYFTKVKEFLLASFDNIEYNKQKNVVIRRLGS